MLGALNTPAVSLRSILMSASTSRPCRMRSTVLYETPALCAINALLAVKVSLAASLASSVIAT